MGDVIWTIVISWLIWKIFSFISVNRATSSFYKEEHHHHYSNKINKEGTTTIQSSQTNQKKYTNKDGDYIDFEEIKNK